MVEKKLIAIKDLNLWDENARFPDTYFRKSEDELISYFTSSKNFRIADLTAEIVKDFDLPQLEKLVVYQTEGKNVVLEGNRRLVCYKLLSNPELIDENELKREIVKLKQQIFIDNTYELECLVTSEEEQGYRYIDRKHLRANNEVAWGDNERAHHNARRGNANQKERLKVAITKIIRGLDLPDDLKEQVLGQGFVTTFWRLLEQSPAWRRFGFTFDEAGNLIISDTNFEDKLKVIILDVLNKAGYNGKLFSRLGVEDIDSYLGNISDEDIKRVDVEVEKRTITNIFGEQTVAVNPAPQTNKSNPKTYNRKFLIPAVCTLTIPEAKINNIYRELKNDLLLDDSKKAVPNAVGVLFRVFLEISIDYFWEKLGNGFKSDTKLAGKITIVAQYLEDEGIATPNQLRNIRTVATDQNSLLGIENFHSYVHSYKSQPSPGDLKLKWDNLQEFFEILWDTLLKLNNAKNAKK